MGKNHRKNVASIPGSIDMHPPSRAPTISLNSDERRSRDSDGFLGPSDDLAKTTAGAFECTDKPELLPQSSSLGWPASSSRRLDRDVRVNIRPPTGQHRKSHKDVNKSASSSQQPSSKWQPTTKLLVFCVLTLLWGLTTTFGPPPLGANSGWGAAECAGPSFEPGLAVCICPRETVCARSIKSVVFLVFARGSAYFDYPMYVLLFVSKAHNLLGFLQRSYLSEFFPFDDMHHLHAYAGAFVGIETMWHAFWHTLRWSLDGDASFLWATGTGRSGLVALFVMQLIVWPMHVPKLRKLIAFEYRKAMHYLSVVWGVALCFHAPATRIFYVMGLAVGIYTLDWVYGSFYRIHYLSTLYFERMGAAVEISWKNPPGFVNSGAGYVYICLPWVSRTQWHAFSVVMHPTKPNHSCVCMATLGDWTSEVHRLLIRPGARPGWVYGPFPSPFSTATGYSNLITVASGIGITPALSTIVSLSRDRSVSLVWICRDPDLVEFYLNKVEFGTDSWTLIYYTGKKRRLVLGQKPKNRKVRVILGRPDLESVLTSIVDNITNELPMPESIMTAARDAEALIYNESPAQRFRSALERAMMTYTPSEMFLLACDCSSTDENPTPTKVNLEGFIKLIRTVADLEENLTDAELEEHFQSADTSRDGQIDENEMADMIEHFRSERCIQKSKSFYGGRSSFMRRTSIQFSSKQEKQATLLGWQVLYCGGSRPVVRLLKNMRKKYSMELKLESFNW